MPEHEDLKLLVPRGATTGWAMGVARKRWDAGAQATEGFYMFSGNRLCSAITRIQTLDTNIPEEVVFDVRKENTFG